MLYFPSLDGFRLLYCLVVVLIHTEMVKKISQLTNPDDARDVFKSFAKHDNWYMIIGELAVSFFFMLSGFLLTYILLSEKEKTGTVSVKKFYIRRILRIWPLYYLLVVLALFVLPQIPFFDFPPYTERLNDKFVQKTLLFLSLLSNIAVFSYKQQLYPYLSQTWSLGVEEQFYFVLPWAIKYGKKYMKLFLGALITYIVVLNVSLVFKGVGFLFFDISVYKYFYYSRFGCIAIGGIAACLLFFGHTMVLNFIYRPFVQIATIAVIVLCFALSIEVPYVHHEFYVSLFAILLLNAAANPGAFLKIENRTINYFGKMTYGVYMYHLIAIPFALHISNYLVPDKWTSVLSNSILYSCTFAFTLGISALSYHFFELKFIKMKEKFTMLGTEPK